MTEAEIKELRQRQEAYFLTGATLPLKSRREALRKLRAAIYEQEDEIRAALKKDLGKSRTESYMCEVGMTLSEISHMLRHLKSYAKDRRVRTPLAQYVSRSFVKTGPRGVCLIMSPWNYPFLLSMEPLVDAIAAGNTVILKPSAYSPATSEVLARLLSRCFREEQAAVVLGGRKENQALLHEKFDYIFFTGSQAVGRQVMAAAAEHLTPVALELGGKSPCIVDERADIALAARRIVFGKFLNCGQTCVAPDYILCHESVKERFLAAVKKEIVRQFGEQPLDHPNYGKIISEKHFDRICSLIDEKKLAFGGKTCRERLQIGPTVLDGVTREDPVMGEEIFGPLMPIVTFQSLDQVIRELQKLPKPLALYIFSQDRKAVQRVTERCAFGGGCVNDTIIHLATSAMGFGGVGESGMGAYHGRAGFDAFSHKKSIVDKKTFLDLPIRYQPYSNIKDRLIRLFLK